MTICKSANRETSKKNNPVPSVRFNGTRYYKLHKSDYYVSKSGVILSLKQKAPRILHTYKIGSGYLMTDLYSHNKRTSVTVHAIVARVFHGKRPKGWDIDHIDGNKLNNHYKNLRYLPKSINRSLPNKGGKQHDAKTVYATIDGKLHKFECIKYFRQYLKIPKWYLERKDNSFPRTSKYIVTKMYKGETTIKITLKSRK